MKVLITGINGFIGRHLAKALILKGYDVIGLDRYRKCIVQGVDQYYSGTILNRILVGKAMDKVDAIIHLAALTAHRDIVDNNKIFLYSTSNVFFNLSEPVLTHYLKRCANAQVDLRFEKSINSKKKIINWINQSDSFIY